MRGASRLAAIDVSTPAMAWALPNLPSAETVLVRLLRLNLASISEVLDGEFRKVGLTELTFQVLCLLMASKDGQATPSDLSDLVGTSRANMTRIIASIVDEGYAVREVEANDARRSNISITPQGRKVTENAADYLAEPIRRIFAGLNEKEFTQLEALLRKCVVSVSDNSYPFGPTGK